MTGLNVTKHGKTDLGTPSEVLDCHSRMSPIGVVVSLDLVPNDTGKLV